MKDHEIAKLVNLITKKLKENPYLKLHNIQQVRDNVSRAVIEAINELKKEKENANNK